MKFKDVLNLSLKNLRDKRTNILWFIILSIFLLMFNILFTVRSTLVNFAASLINNDITERYINVESKIGEVDKTKADIENLNISNVVYVFASSNDTLEILDITNNKDINGTITLYGLYPGINADVIKGKKDLNDNEMICSDAFYPGYYENKTSNELYDMSKYLNSDFIIKTEKILLTDNFEHKVIKDDSYTLKLVGLYNQKNNLMGYDVCYTNKNTFEKIKSMNSLAYESKNTETNYYEYMGYENKKDVIVLVNNYKERQNVLKVLREKGYNANIIYEYDTEYLDNMCLIVKIITIILTVGFCIIMLLFITKTVRKDMATISLYKIIGYKNNIVHKIFFYQYAILGCIGYIMVLFLSLIAKNIVSFVLKKGAITRIFTIKLNFCFSFLFLVGTFLFLYLILVIHLKALNKNGQILKELEE